MRDISGDQNPAWKGGRITLGDGYVGVYMPGHPHANAQHYVLEHVAVASAVLGKPLPEGAQVHHVNQVRDDNRNCNLVICEDAAYHNILHARMRAHDACGHADWIQCSYCREWGPVDSMTPQSGARGYHKPCRSADALAKARRRGVKPLGSQTHCKRGHLLAENRFPSGKPCQSCSAEAGARRRRNLRRSS